MSNFKFISNAVENIYLNMHTLHIFQHILTPPSKLNSQNHTNILTSLTHFTCQAKSSSHLEPGVVRCVCVLYGCLTCSLLKASKLFGWRWIHTCAFSYCLMGTVVSPPPPHSLNSYYSIGKLILFHYKDLFQLVAFTCSWLCGSVPIYTNCSILVSMNVSYVLQNSLPEINAMGAYQCDHQLSLFLQHFEPVDICRLFSKAAHLEHIAVVRSICY